MHIDHGYWAKSYTIPMHASRPGPDGRRWLMLRVGHKRDRPTCPYGRGQRLHPKRAVARGRTTCVSLAIFVPYQSPSPLSVRARRKVPGWTGATAGQLSLLAREITWQSDLACGGGKGDLKDPHSAQEDLSAPSSFYWADVAVARKRLHNSRTKT